MKKTILFLTLITMMVAASIACSEVLLPGNSAGKDIVTTCTKDKISIDLQYSGDKIYFFGTVPEKGAQVIVKLVSGASDAVKLSQKGKVGLFWMGVKQYKVTNMPYMYKIHSSAKLDQILTPELAKQLGVGYDNLKQNMKLELIKGNAPPDTDMVYDGFLKVKEKENLYKIAEERVNITQDRLFQHYFTFPPKAGEGTYKVITYAVKDGKLLSSCENNITIQKVGLGKWMATTAAENGILYGILSVGVAVSAGLLVGMVFKGGGH